MKAKITKDHRLVIHPESNEEWLAASKFLYKRTDRNSAVIDKPFIEAFYIEFKEEEK